MTTTESPEPVEDASAGQTYRRLAGRLRDRLAPRRALTVQAQRAAGARVLHYLSAEYLPGRQLEQNLVALGEPAREVAQATDAVRDWEVEAPLGNGGLARLAACVMESTATLDLPAVGHGLRYDFGTFQQAADGAGEAGAWAVTDNPWEAEEPLERRTVAFGGHTEDDGDPTGLRRRWVPQEHLDGVPSVMLIPGHGTGTVNPIRFWRAVASPDALDPARLAAGEYAEAVEQAARAENITRVYYPDEASEVGRELRLRQQYFLVSCALQEIVGNHLAGHDATTGRDPWSGLAASVVVQLNETHPALAVVELMRLLVDEHRVEWDRAWTIVTKVFGYTVHTLLPEALQTWPVPLMQRLLPRHMEIILSINYFFLQGVAVRFPGDIGRLGALSLIQEGSVPQVRMAHLAAASAKAVNGVADQHTRLLTGGAFASFATMWPAKFCSVTNGVSQRRFLRLANPVLAELITEGIEGDHWLRDAEALTALVPLAEDASFREAWLKARRMGRERLSDHTRRELELELDPDALCDVMIKKFHEYKRQLLKALHVVTLYNRIVDDPTGAHVPRTVVFAGSADPGYHPGRTVIRLVRAVAAVVNRDPACAGRLRVLYHPDLSVTRSELITPAADVSEQISMAGMEASGTGNMKLALNGALTVATMGGANIELLHRLGPDSVRVFGLDAAGAAALRSGDHEPYRHYGSDHELRAALDALSAGAFCDESGESFAPLVERVLNWDPYLTLADYRSYVDAQDRLEAAWQDPVAWARTSIRTTARCGYFSSDRTVREYNERIWHLRAVPVEPIE